MAKRINPGSIIHTLPSGRAWLYLLPLLILFVASCSSITGDLKGTKTQNNAPEVDFANVPADGDTFSFAPVVYWKGRDSDGFVEHYLYADVIDPTALANPDYFIDFIPENAWVRTEATSDTVFLLTEEGDITKHIFYLKCVDDQGMESQVKYRTFSRSNHPPNVPLVKWWLDADDEYGTDIFVDDTLFCLENPTETWYGLGFNWKATDPDDRDFYTIPLQYKYYLEKVPHDTIWEWVSQDWTSKQDIVLSGLETGHYTFSVWSRDDGLEISERAASATFDVYEPTFDEDILILNTTPMSGQRNTGFILPGSRIGEYYDEKLSEWDSRTLMNFPNDTLNTLHKAFLGRFRLIIWCDENRLSSIMSLENDMVNYLDVGGRLWITGTFLQSKAEVRGTLLSRMNSTFIDPQAQYIAGPPVDFTGGISSVEDMPDFDVDTTKISEAYLLYRSRPHAWLPYPYQPGVDVLAGGSGTQTAYYYRSYTDTLNGDIFNEQAKVRLNADTVYFPPTPQAALLKLERNRVVNVSRVFNVTKGVTGEVVNVTNNALHLGNDVFAVVRVSYPWGEPWATSDSVVVDYEYLPYSEFHLRPVAIRYERLSEEAGGSGIIVGYRIAMFTFPLYFVDNSNGAADQIFKGMLDWFFYPAAHS